MRFQQIKISIPREKRLFSKTLDLPSSIEQLRSVFEEQQIAKEAQERAVAEARNARARKARRAKKIMSHLQSSKNRPSPQASTITHSKGSANRGKAHRGTEQEDDSNSAQSSRAGSRKGASAPQEPASHDEDSDEEEDENGKGQVVNSTETASAKPEEEEEDESSSESDDSSESEPSPVSSDSSHHEDKRGKKSSHRTLEERKRHEKVHVSVTSQHMPMPVYKNTSIGKSLEQHAHTWRAWKLNNPTSNMDFESSILTKGVKDTLLRQAKAQKSLLNAWSLRDNKIYESSKWGSNEKEISSGNLSPSFPVELIIAIARPGYAFPEETGGHKMVQDKLDQTVIPARPDDPRWVQRAAERFDKILTAGDSQSRYSMAAPVPVELERALNNLVKKDKHYPDDSYGRAVHKSVRDQVAQQNKEADEDSEKTRFQSFNDLVLCLEIAKVEISDLAMKASECGVGKAERDHSSEADDYDARSINSGDSRDRYHSEKRSRRRSKRRREDDSEDDGYHKKKANKGKGSSSNKPRYEKPRHEKPRRGRDRRGRGKDRRDDSDREDYSRERHQGKDKSHHDSDEQSAEKCRHCGRAPHRDECAFVTGRHPHCNMSELDYDISPMGKRWWREKRQRVVPFNEDLDGNRVTTVHIPTEKPKVQKPKESRKGESLLTIIDKKAPTNTTTTYILLPNSQRLKAQAMLDTGALKGSYCSLDIARELIRSGQIGTEINRKVCSGFSGESKTCQIIKRQFLVNLCIKDERTQENKEISLTVKEAEIQFDLIIGREDIKTNGLALICPSQFFDAIRDEESPELTTRVDKVAQIPCTCQPCAGQSIQPKGDIPTSSKRRREELMNLSPKATARRESLDQGTVLRLEEDSAIRESTKVVGEPEYDIVCSFDSDTSTLLWDATMSDDADDKDKDKKKSSIIPTEIHGSPALQARIRSLCLEFSDIWSEELTNSPADLPPLTLNVDEVRWAKCRGPPRPQSVAKQDEIRRQVNKMLELELVRPSQAIAYSQVLLTPKPGGKSRFCIDLRELNDCTESLGWPVPNIGQMLRRVGSHKPKFFSKVDFTQGYFQVPLAEASKRYSAFITFMGIYEWNRLPMGLKSAASYFQQTIATRVLAGMIHVNCELYIDDALTWGETEDELIANMRMLFLRFRKYRVMLNPHKAVLGVRQITYVGHLIDEHGMSFERAKLDEVGQYPRPIYQKQLKAFLGLANFYHANVRNHSMIVAPLNKLMAPYEKAKKIVWNDETIESFEKIKKAIQDCPTLYFLSRNGPITLLTDASNYGVGAVLNQLVDGVERPVAFVSRSFRGAEKNWAAVEKEAYAAVFAFKKLDHLLRDVRFTWKTDHKNWLTLKTETNPKVTRWKLLMQEYDFKPEYIEGPRNIVGDCLSRVCEIDDETSEEDTLAMLVDEDDDVPELICLMEEVRIPREVYKLIGAVHNTIVGHHGVESTLAKLLEKKQTWLYMREHVKAFIKQCPCCQKMSALKVPIKLQGFTLSSLAPFQRIMIDSIGPLPEDAEGNKHILVTIDCFTRFIELDAVKSLHADTAARALLKIFGRYGPAREICSDNGPQFVNAIITALLNIVGTQHTLAMAYSHEEQAIVERANKEVMRHLRAIIFDKKIEHAWSTFLPLVQRIFNSEAKAPIGVSPAKLLFGNAVDLNQGIFIDQRTMTKELVPIEGEHRGEKVYKLSPQIPMTKWAADMLKYQKIAIETAQRTQLETNRKHLEKASNSTTEFAVNSWVLVGSHPNMDGIRRPPSKINTLWKGPRRVVSSQGARYTVYNPITNKNEEYLVKDLKQYYFDPETSDPKDAALADVLEYYVEEVLDHKGSQRKKSEMKFLVKWQGYPESENSWVDWKELRLVDKLHDYLRAHKMAKLVPQLDDDTNDD